MVIDVLFMEIICKDAPKQERGLFTSMLKYAEEMVIDELFMEICKDATNQQESLFWSMLTYTEDVRC